ncbi:GDP-mannose transporter GONST5 [Hypsizygus marmoreus]|uniref:GDP-mannose transporter GONST5 n=1 Tax=Hypsizygus marmoreus TaxID=39966 RepID=A0A369JMD1_HYPMA|nr:GDP-mannose transporter GONST5 [Hypsizygus marmoreus]
MSIAVPSSSSKLSWFHQALDEPRHEFAPNASFSSYRVDNAKKHLELKHAKKESTTDISDDIPNEDSEDKRAMSVDGNPSTPAGAIRNRPNIRSHRHRVFHDDQPYPPRLVSEPSNGKLRDLPLELPSPTSPTRRRAFRRNNCFHALSASIRSRLPSHPTTYLVLYFTLNLSLTLYNKSLLINFPFPYTLSAIHALCGSIGSLILVKAGAVPPPRLTVQETLVLLAFSGLYTVNIIVSNVSLGLVTVPFHQVVRASTPLFTILFSYVLLGTRSSRAKLIALVPVVAGVGFATYGDYYFTPWGFFLTLLGTVLAALKTIYTHLLQAPSLPHSNTNPRIYNLSPKSPPSKSSHSLTRNLFHRSQLPPLTPLHLLYLLSPLAFVQATFLAQFSGELDRVRAYSAGGIRYPHTSGFTRGQPLSAPGLSNTQLALLVMNGVTAFGLNVVSFSANRKVGALSMTVAANVKQVLTILCAVILFDVTITPMNGVGIVLTLVGGVVYALVELKERQKDA